MTDNRFDVSVGTCVLTCIETDRQTDRQTLHRHHN